MDTIMSIVNQITITVQDADMIIGGIAVIMFGWTAKQVWDTITNVGRR
jgi:hypothetical protein